MSKFEVVSKYTNSHINLPKRATANAAGYDFEVAEDCMLPSYASLIDIMKIYHSGSMTLDQISEYTKKVHTRPTLVPTGIKCKLESWEYLELSVRSSLPLKHWIILANGVGIVDSDYYNNESNEGQIYFQLINLSPFTIYLKKGDRIGQGIIRTYGLIEKDYYGQGAERIGGFGSTPKKLYNEFVNIHGETYDIELPTTKTAFINAPYIIGNSEMTVPIEPKYITTTNVDGEIPYEDYQMTFEDLEN